MVLDGDSAGLVPGAGQGHLHTPGLLLGVVGLHLVCDCVVIAVITYIQEDQTKLNQDNSIKRILI